MSGGVAANLKVVFSADTNSYSVSVKNAAKQLGDFEKSATSAGKVARTQMADARGTVMVLGEEIGVHLPRHVQAFVAKLPGAQAALSAAFSATAVIAIGVAVFEIGEKIVKFAEKNEEAARKNAATWREMSASMSATNDDLQVANDKLEMAIAKLEHKPENGLKLAIDEAIQSADALGAKLDADAQKIAETLKLQEPGILSQVLDPGLQPTADVTEHAHGLAFQLDQIQIEQQSRLATLKQQGASQDAIDRATAELDAKRKAAIAKEIKGWAQPELAQTQWYNPVLKKTGTRVGDEERVQALTHFIASFQSMADFVDLSQRHGVLEGQHDQAQVAHDNAEVAAKAYAAVLANEMKAVPEHIKLLVDTPTKEREQRDRVFKSTLGAPTGPAGGFKDVAGEMDQDLGRYGPKWKEYNNLVSESALSQTKLSTQLALTKMHIEETTGAITPHVAALIEAQSHAKQYAADLEVLQEELKGILSDGTLAPNERETQAQKVRNKIGDLNGQNQVQSAEDQARIKATTALGEFHDRLMKTIDDFTNLGNAISDVTIRAIEEFNATLIKVLSTPANMMRGKHPFDQLGASVAESAGGAALRYAEGSAMKAMSNIPGLGKLFKANEKLGTQANPMWVKLAAGAAAADSAAASAIAKLSPGGGGNGGGAGSSIASFALGAAGLPHFAGGGAIPANMPAIVGENGPEMLLPRNPGVIVPNGKFGGSSVTINNHFDNRGAGDPAAVEAASRRAVLGAAPHMIAAAKASIQDENRRRPASRGR